MDNINKPNIFIIGIPQEKKKISVETCQMRSLLKPSQRAIHVHTATDV